MTRLPLTITNDMVHALAVKEGVCVRPVLRRVTAHDLAVRRMSHGDIDGARWAVRQGRSVDELTEILAREAHGDEDDHGRARDRVADGDGATQG